MNIRFLHLTIFSCFILLLSACSKDSADPLPKDPVDEEPSYVKPVSDVKVYAGKNRLQLVWPAMDPSIVKAKIYWNERANSMDVPLVSTVDSTRVTLKDLAEGSYSFEIITIDKDDNQSGRVLINGKTYGDAYAEGLTQRPLSNLTVKDGSLKVDWKAVEQSTMIASEVKYTDANGVEKVLVLKHNELSSQLPNLPDVLRGTIQYRTLYRPEPTAIDTFYTAFTTAPYVDRAAVFDSLPGWKFRCKVMAEAKTIEDHGGMIAFKEKMDAAMIKASKKFQVPGLNDAGNNEIHFYMSEIESFTGRSSQFTTKQWVNDNSLDVMLVVNDNAVAGDDSWGWRRSPYLTLGHDYDGLFGNSAVDALLHEFGHTRGMYDLYLSEVPNGANNPLNGEPYEAKRCIMNYPYGETVWSELSKFIINESAGGRVAVGYWDYFPSVFKITVKQKNGAAASNAKLNFYPVFANSNAVRETDVVKYRGSTDAAGNYTFQDNPYAIDQNIRNNVYNYLVQIDVNGHKQYRWMPLDEALLAGSKGQPFIFDITLD